MDPFESYKLYNALKLNFEQESYDAIKYNFKTNIKPQSFFARKDKYFFAKLAKNYGNNLLEYYVANFKNGVSYVGDMINEEGESNYTAHKKIMESLTREFEKDINKWGSSKSLSKTDLAKLPSYIRENKNKFKDWLD